MMRHRYIVTTLALLLFFVSAIGKPVTITEVREAVYALLQSFEKNLDIKGIETRYLPDGELGYYMVDLGQDGWVMVSGDDVVRPVLAFSFENSMTPENEWNDAARYMLNQYQAEISGALKNRYLQRDTRWDRAVLPSVKKASEAESVLPFIDVTWNQGGEWNMFCPEDPDGPGGHAYVGCVAVAMAQAMSVYEYPVRPKGIKSYVHPDYGSIAVNYDMADPYKWSEMSSTSADSSNAILLYHCAVSVEMDFGADGSGAYVRTAASSMKDYFSYSQSLLFKERYADADEWEALMVDELAAGRPIVYRGNPSDGTAGHAWNLDGWRSISEVEYFHMNFGWSGSQNGYYTLDNITPGSYEFNSNQGALIGIAPPSSAPYDLSLSEQTVLEGLPIGSWVADVEVTDENPDNTYTFTCKGPFSILLDDYGPAAFYIENGQLFTDQIFTYNETNPAANSKFLLIIVEDQYGTIYQEEFQIVIESDQSGSTGITEISLEDDLLFPNPANHLVTLSSPELNSTLEIYEIATGRKVLMQNVVAETVDVSALAEGFYLVVIRSLDGVSAQKLLIHD